MPNRLIDIFVTNISLVDEPANGRKFLLIKAAGGLHMNKAKSAVDEREALVAAYIQAHPAETRDNAVYAATEGLYERCRLEETNTKHGETLRETYDRVQVAGISKSANLVETEVLREMNALMSKSATLTVEQARDQVFRDNPALWERWNREARA